MENLGSLAILLALCLSGYAILASLVGKWRDKPLLVLSAERAVYGIWALLTIASGILVYSLITGDFRLAYVAGHSNRAMPVFFKFAAWWGGMEGSLLLWAWILSSYSALVVFTNRFRFRDMMPYVVAILMAVQCFFLLLISFPENPFQVLAVGKGITEVPDGNGLNPLLQYWAMVIHPPMLYLGYVGFVVPFAFAMGSLITRQPGDAWIHTTRRWTILTWGFQSAGILLGAGWAYAVLGWGGYWGWDPVENASLLPWITATAFLHSVMMQEKKGMMKVWNMVLISATFFLCIFGTFLTRSGIVGSVHAFAQSPIGKYFVAFLAIGIAATIYLILDRLDYLKSEAHLESVLSRESSFLFNNLILLASCFAVLWGTIFPVISEAVTGEKISVDAPFYNRVNVPIGLFLLFLTGVGPLIAWRRSSIESLKKAFLWPSLLGLSVMAALLIAGVRHFYALMSFGLCAFVLATILMEFWKGSRAIAAKTGQNLLLAAVELTHRNTRRYGGYIVHMAIVFMFIGFTGSAFNLDSTNEVRVGDKFSIGRYELKVRDLLDGDNDNYAWRRAVIDVYIGGRQVATLNPEQRVYKASRQSTSEVSIRRRLNEDLYLNFAGVTNDGRNLAIIQSYVFPLVSWIWIGFVTLLFGTAICLIPSKVKMQYARTEVVGYVERHAAVTK
ncbi:MAG: heme lyase CcmF/NrfE family subunit [Bryobacteraceae bacterium]|nr:heme lyase CcmF/NrfE family subunit [Bryobacteraceae bacterium]MDW8379714.1 heme lyase CcmF/NrfE family subunit [Bryobacterales bacterium]